MRRRLEGHAVISGVGQSAVGRRLGRSATALTVDACLAAIADAGLEPLDIDGVATFPGAVDGLPGFGPVGIPQVLEALRLQVNWYNGGMESPGQLGSVITAAAAVATGYARHVLCFRTVTEGSAQADAGRAGVTLGGGGSTRIGRIAGFDGSWFVPFGAASAANWTALYAQRHFHEYGTTREQLAQIALTCRANAANNPNAVYRTPLSLEDYLTSRMISSPLCLYDCDVPCDASTAVIVSDVETAADLRRPPIRIEAAGSAMRGRYSWDQWQDLTTMPLHDAAAMLWERTDLQPTDIDVAELYDGFSFFTLAWLEALGFCKKGEGGPYIGDGRHLRIDGQLPLNTNGGQLSGGRTHGYGLLHEACLQLWGEAGGCQVPRRPSVAVAAAGGGTSAGCLLLRRW